MSTREAGPGWADVHLVHSALPATDLAAVDLSTALLGHRLAAPLVIAAMTGGHPMAREVNRRLAGAAERHGLAMGLGSQRAGLLNRELTRTYSVARETAPHALLIANIGAAQLLDQASGPALGQAEVSAAIRMIGADALAIHLNFLEESVQTEGDRRAAGIRGAIRAAVAAAGVPGDRQGDGGRDLPSGRPRAGGHGLLRPRRGRSGRNQLRRRRGAPGSRERGRARRPHW